MSTHVIADSTLTEVEQAGRAAGQAFAAYSALPPEQIAVFLESIGDEIQASGDELLACASSETALPIPRLTGERARTVNQLKMFASLVREGSWVDARIDLARPERQPLPKPDLRRMLFPLGPVAVFSASNFPLAFSVAGGDTASALAAGNPVIVKAHPGHPRTSELTAAAIRRAVEKTGIPAGTFSLLHGRNPEVSVALVKHPAIKAVGFTGSLRAGRALFDAGASRPKPIPVFAEMGSTNPIFLLPGALSNPETLAADLLASVTLGVGQFCTNPGLVLGLAGAEMDSLKTALGKLVPAATPGTMLYPALCDHFHEAAAEMLRIPGVIQVGRSSAACAPGQAPAIVFSTDAATFRGHASLQEELFGPATLLLNCSTAREMETIAESLPGQLTASLHGAEDDLHRHTNLVRILQGRVGRLLFNGFPTGVEVCPSMHHGGPYPATTDSRFTSVGTAAIQRFARPVCYQGFPQAALRPELRNKNERGIWRLVDGQLTKSDC